VAAENELMAKVLLIEDDSETAEEITAELTDRGFEVEWSANGIEGLGKARSGRPDVMIVDRLLPGMDGLMVIEALRKEQVRTPVLVLSALGAVNDRVRGLRMGGDDYLTKPFALVELVARIEALLRRPAESRETTLRAGPLELDLIERTAKRGDRAIDLLPRVSAARIYDAAERPAVDPSHAAGGGLELQIRSGDQPGGRAYGPAAAQGGRPGGGAHDPQCPRRRLHPSHGGIGLDGRQ
jgi:CheY-like chemotaxis protein